MIENPESLLSEDERKLEEARTELRQRHPDSPFAATQYFLQKARFYGDRVMEANRNKPGTPEEASEGEET